jgi:NADPH:quinone reductase-like Zn-dependent oxidoreductase
MQTIRNAHSFSRSIMQALVVERRGDVNVLAVREMPRPPAPAPSELRVKVKATSVNPVDIKVRTGKYDDYPGTSELARSSEVELT